MTTQNAHIVQCTAVPAAAIARSTIEGNDIDCGQLDARGQSLGQCRVCGDLNFLISACQDNPSCVAFTYDGSCGFLKSSQGPTKYRYATSALLRHRLWHSHTMWAVMPLVLPTRSWQLRYCVSTQWLQVAYLRSSNQTLILEVNWPACWNNQPLVSILIEAHILRMGFGQLAAKSLGKPARFASCYSRYS